jgi:peptidoglycan/xylan/chitin deacetylase (PgdA/CDA1 family)
MTPFAILTYHSIDTSGSVISTPPRTFAEQMELLAAEGFRGVTLREAVAHRRRHGDWPARSVALTFDDGYANFTDSALPALAAHGFTATVFVISGHAGGQNAWVTPPARPGRRAMLSWEQLRALAAAAIEIGAHTRSHKDLRQLPDAELRREIIESRNELADQLGERVESFAYPFGAVSPAAASVVQAEFTAACTTVLRRATTEPLHLLPRIDMYYVRGPRALWRLVTGRLDPYLAIRRWGRALRAAPAA